MGFYLVIIVLRGSLSCKTRSIFFKLPPYFSFLNTIQYSDHFHLTNAHEPRQIRPMRISKREFRVSRLSQDGFALFHSPRSDGNLLKYIPISYIFYKTMSTIWQPEKKKLSTKFFFHSYIKIKSCVLGPSSSVNIIYYMIISNHSNLTTSDF